MARRTVGVGLAMILIAASAGCGISASPHPAKMGEGLVAGANQGGATEIEPRSPGAASRPEELVELYFDAATGGGDAGAERVRTFLTPKARSAWAPGQVVTVVRIRGINLDEVGGGTATVSVRYQRVGVLDDGAIEPSNDQDTFTTVTFTLESLGGLNQWRITNPPQGMLLRDTALTTWYLAKPIYFWDTAGQSLVPDLRYLPLTKPVDQRPDQLVDWLLAGPSGWLSPAVARSVPAGTVKLGNVVTTRNNVVVVNLSARAGSDTKGLQHLVDQVRWSLRAVTQSPVELQIEGQKKDVDGSSEQYLAANPSYVMENTTPQQFGVVKGKVVALPVTSAAATQPVLKASVNSNVLVAAINNRNDRAAYVRAGHNTRTLALVRTNGDSDSGQVRKVEVSLDGSGPVSRPAWIPGTDQLLIAVNGELRTVTLGGQRSTITPAALRGVTSIAVAPDGRRVALVANGEAYVGALVVEGNTISVGPQLRAITPPGNLTAAAISWTSGFEVLVVGAEGDKPVMWQATADGAYVEKRTLGSPGYVLTDVAAFPDGLMGAGKGAEVIVQASGRGAYFVFGQSLVQVSGGVTAPFYPN